jgi:hypothetical protein
VPTSPPDPLPSGPALPLTQFAGHQIAPVAVPTAPPPDKARYPARKTERRGAVFRIWRTVLGRMGRLMSVGLRALQIHSRVLVQLVQMLMQALS